MTFFRPFISLQINKILKSFLNLQQSIKWLRQNVIRVVHLNQKAVKNLALIIQITQKCVQAIRKAALKHTVLSKTYQVCNCTWIRSKAYFCGCTGGPRLVRILGFGKNRTMRNSYQCVLHSQFPLVLFYYIAIRQKFHQY